MLIKYFLMLIIPIVGFTNEIIDAYFKNFEKLAKAEKWEEIIIQGSAALDVAIEEGNTHDEAKICAQLTSTSYYKGDYLHALDYATRCHELSEKFDDQTLYVRALYLESAIYRAQENYEKAVATAEEALKIYDKKNIHNFALLGKVFFNLGAAYADDPNGDLTKAEENYERALKSFKKAKANDDLIRTSLRLGKVYLLQKKYDLSEKIVKKVRPKINSERIAMHADYLEAQLLFALNAVDKAKSVAEKGLEHAKVLGASEDEKRFVTLLDEIKKVSEEK